MKKYLITIIMVSICVGLINVISPQFRGFEKYTKMIGMLIVLCILISPVKELMQTFDKDSLDNIKDEIIDSDSIESDKYNEMFKDYLTSFSIEEIKNEISAILLEKYGIPDSECEIIVSTKEIDGRLKISSMQILLSGKSVFKNPYIIEAYFSDLLNCSCQVLIK